MKLQLKNQYVGTKITKQHPTLGTLTFDANIHPQNEYDFFYHNGFADLFLNSEVSEKIETNENKAVTSKKYKGIKNNGKQEEN